MGKHKIIINMTEGKAYCAPGFMHTLAENTAFTQKMMLGFKNIIT